ncbi:MAG: hypothetical protein D3923_20105 [Candidatus Electrothrix sp. AR3]|nr:hypothetical protein [Candidatus Electrothrix sp. AR3]
MQDKSIHRILDTKGFIIYSPFKKIKIIGHASYWVDTLCNEKTVIVFIAILTHYKIIFLTVTNLGEVAL